MASYLTGIPLLDFVWLGVYGNILKYELKQLAGSLTVLVEVTTCMAQNDTVQYTIIARRTRVPAPHHDVLRFHHGPIRSAIHF